MDREKRNKKYMETPTRRICGKDSCHASNDTYDGSLTCVDANYKNLLQNCESDNKYTNARDMNGYSTSHCKRGDGWNFMWLKVCDKKSVDNSVFNVLETEYGDETKRTKPLLKEIDDCCTGLYNTDRCGNLWQGIENKEPLCNTYMNDVCMKSVDTLNDPDCIKWCKANPLICKTSKIKDFCAKVKPGDPTYSNLCGCYYPESFYINLRDELASKWNIPSEFLSGGKSCYSSACGGSDLIPLGDREKCKEVSLSQCNQTINIEGTKVVLASNALTQNADCKNAISMIKKGSSKSCTKDSECGSLKCSSVTKQCEASPTAKPCSTNEPCSGGLICTSGKCIEANSTDDSRGDSEDDSKSADGQPCTGNTDCTSSYCNTEKKCATKPVDEPKSNLPLIIGLSVGGLVLLLIIAGVLFKMKSSSSSSTGTSAVSS